MSDVKPFRGCRYEVHITGSAGRWSRHLSFDAAWKSYRSLVINGHARGEVEHGTVIELRDISTGKTLYTESARWS